MRAKGAEEEIDTPEVIIASLREAVVRFNELVEVHEVPPYCEQYPLHPRCWVATRDGRYKKLPPSADSFTGKSRRVMDSRRARMPAPDRRKRESILRWVLRHGAKWEERTGDRIVRISALKAKQKKKRLGAKKVRMLERTLAPGEALTDEDATAFRALAARANYLAADRPDLMFSSKELCREFAQPTRASFTKLKRLVRYLVGAQR